MKKTLFLFAVIVLPIIAFSQKYAGDNILKVLGQKKDSSQTYLEFAREWGLGKKTSNYEKGIKVTKNSETGTIIAVSFAGKGYEIGDYKFEPFTGAIPFGLSVADNYESLRNKLGVPKKEYEKVAKFAKNGLNIIVTFKNNSRSKIELIKIALGFGQLEYNPDEWLTKPTEVAVNETVAQSVNTAKSNEPTETEMRTKAIEQKTTETIKPATTTSSSTTTATSRPEKNMPPITETMPATFDKPATPSAASTSSFGKSSFYKAVMEVMEDGTESNYEGIQVGELTTVPNTWNYKHTYKTNVNVPGTLYNFVYRFPFPTSQKDWVAVIKEGNYDASFKSTYDEILAKIKKDFPSSEGWKYSNPLDEDPNFPLKDFEAQNNKFGSVILDYHQLPSGKSVLYLRLLLYYN